MGLATQAWDLYHNMESHVNVLDEWIGTGLAIWEDKIWARLIVRRWEQQVRVCWCERAVQNTQDRGSLKATVVWPGSFGLCTKIAPESWGINCSAWFIQEPLWVMCSLLAAEDIHQQASYCLVGLQDTSCETFVGQNFRWGHTCLTTDVHRQLLPHLAFLASCF